MTQEQELKKGQMGYKKSSDFSEKRAGEGNLLANSRMISEQGNLCYCILTLQYIKRHLAEYMLVLVNLHGCSSIAKVATFRFSCR